MKAAKHNYRVSILYTIRTGIELLEIVTFYDVTREEALQEAEEKAERTATEKDYFAYFIGYTKEF